MAAFKHHSCFPKAKMRQQYRFPFVCFACRKSFKYPPVSGARVCPQCQRPMEMLSRKFSAPKSKDLDQWAKVEYLVSRGFRFYTAYVPHESGGRIAVKYPDTLKEAEDFVARVGAQVGNGAI